MRNRDLGRQNEAAKAEIAEHKSEISNPKSKISSPFLLPAGHPLGGSPLPAPSARLVRAKDCHWNGQLSAPEVGQTLPLGQPLRLASGVAEIEFEIGAKVILQSPAAFELLSANSARLEMGKATVEIKNERARGFKIFTPEATFVDQGTEFGVEVAPGGSSKVHVFRGMVDVDRIGPEGRSAPLIQRLMGGVGARMEPGDKGMTTIQDTGECFIRSLDDADRDHHVVAYWRFEDRPVGAILPDTGCNVRPVCASVDSSFNGNDLYTYIPESRPTFSDRVTAAVIPQTGCLNRSCLDTYSVPSYKGYGRDVYTHSKFSHAAPIDIQKITPREWTIEASVWPHSVNGESFPQTFVGRDATYAPSRVG